MSCGNAHETDCSEVLDHLYEYLDDEMSEDACAKFKQHFDECHPCLEKYGLEQAVKKLVKRCCGSDEVPSDLRSKVMMRIEMIRAGQADASQPLDHDGRPDAPAGDRPQARADAQPADQPGARPSEAPSA